MSVESGPRMLVEASQEEEYVISIRELFQVIRRRIWIIALTVFLFVGATVGISLLQTPEYEASIKILVGQEAQSEPSGSLPVDSLQGITQTLAVAIDSSLIAQEVIRQQELEMTPKKFLNRMSIEQIGVTQFIEISYVSESPETAQRVVNAIGGVFSERAADMDLSANKIAVEVYEPALTPTSPVSPNPARNGVLALVAGSMLGVGLAFLLEHLDDRWRSPEEAEQISGVPTFGVIPIFEDSKVKKGDN